MMQNKEMKYEDLLRQLEDQTNELRNLQYQLDEANETIEAIRTGQIDALVVHGHEGHKLYTLRSADQSYRVFIEKMTEGAVTLNRQGVIVYSNSQFALLVTMPLSKVIGLPFDNFISPENQDDYRKLLSKSWTVDSKGEANLIAGTERTPVQLSLTTLELEDGLALSVIITDLSYQKAIQEQLKKNNKQLELTNQKLEASNHDLQQFASVASHDLQEPVRKIQIFSRLLKNNENELSTDSQKYLGKIIDSSTRMKKLIIDILNYSRLSANDLSMESIDLNELVKELVEDFELLINEKQAQIIVGLLPRIEANKGQIRQVFQNILSNALKFSATDRPPVINVQARQLARKSFDSVGDQYGPYHLICIQDNGIGFDDAYVNNIFALFERLNSKSKYEGTGIGMAIAKKIIEKHSGLITATAKEGFGAEFKIILPTKQIDI